MQLRELPRRLARLDVEAGARWAALVGFIASLIGAARVANVQVHPLAGWALLVVVSGAVALWLWRRRLDELSVRREVAAARGTSEPLRVPGEAGEGGTLAMPSGWSSDR